MKKLALLLGLIMIFSFSLVEVSNGAAATVVKKAASTTVKTADKYVHVSFNKEFTLKSGQMAKVDGANVILKIVSPLDKPKFNGGNPVVIQYSVTAKGKTIEQSFIHDQDGMQNMFGAFNPYEVTIVNYGKGFIKAKIAKETVADPPLVLSGDVSDQYTTKKQEYVVSDKFVLYLDKGVTVNGNVMTIIKRIMDDIEKQTGLKYNVNTIYSKYATDVCEINFDEPRKFRAVDPQNKKIGIYVVNDNSKTPYAFESGILVTANDILLDTGNNSAVIHELCHTVHLRNGENLGGIMTEGFATYMTMKVIENDKTLNSDFDSMSNYSNYETEITKETAEDLFINTSDTWDRYLYGFRFTNFLYKTYGDKVFINILNKANQSHDKYGNQLPVKTVLAAVKSQTSEDVFIRFAEWYQKEWSNTTPN